ncbi:MAG: ABATE domain-containing protein, partial [Pseudonocardiaceae bacterium]
MTSSAVERDVILVLAFLNTLDAEGGTDVLDDPVAWRHWVHERGLGAPGAPGEVRSARDALRAAAAGEPGGSWPGV